MYIWWKNVQYATYRVVGGMKHLHKVAVAAKNWLTNPDIQI